ncbi:MAG UNVERIFIED_CONTAM: hypothetical protein MIN83_26155 [Paenibacillus polymyxa]
MIVFGAVNTVEYVCEEAEDWGDQGLVYDGHGLRHNGWHGGIKGLRA